MASPPVARMNFVLGCFNTWPVTSKETSWMHSTSPSGAPASFAASCTNRAASVEHLRARGCGKKSTALPLFSAIKDLAIAVEVGLVVGHMAAIGPTGLATSSMPALLSWRMVPTVLRSLYEFHTYSAAYLFFTYLSSTWPMRVSLTAISANTMPCFIISLATWLKTSSTCC